MSSNIFGLTNSEIQNEKTTLNPNSIYALAKATALQACKMYSRVYNLFICGAIYYNHESPRRNTDYVSQKIVKSVCEIYYGKRDYLYLGDLKAKIEKFRGDEIKHKNIAYKSGATNKGIYSIMDKNIIFGVIGAGFLFMCGGALCFIFFALFEAFPVRKLTKKRQNFHEKPGFEGTNFLAIHYSLCE